MRHPEYNDGTIVNDVALIFLPREITYVPRVELNRDANFPAVGQVLEVFGWGATCQLPGTECPEEDATPNVIQTGNLEYVTNAECQENKGGAFNITEDMLCARTNSTDGVAVGSGDSGMCDSWSLILDQDKDYITLLPPLPRRTTCYS